MGLITDQNIIEKIKNSLVEIRPFLEADGGDIKFVELTDDWIVKVQLEGACSSCDISMSTMRNGVEVVIKKAVPQVKKVIEISQTS
tara:strand:+ start:225 stop:482 length:258 start_codon:yes stop_codon:yes gene_type:complete